MAVNMGEADGRISLDTSGFDQAVQRIISLLGNMSTQIQSASDTLSQMQGTLSGLGNSAQEPVQQLTGLSRILETVRNGLTTFNDSSNTTHDRLQGLADASVTVGQAWTDNISKPLINVGKDMVEMAANFEYQMDRVGTISGATGEELQQLTDYALEMGNTTVFSSQQCAEAMEYMAMAGWEVDEVMAGLPAVLNLAAIGQADLSTTSDIVTDALTAFGAEASDATRLADIMAATITNANTDVEKLGQTFKYVAPVAASAGYSMEETATMIGLMSDAGIKASQAGTSLRATISRLTTQSGEAGEAMNDLGISITNEDGSMLSLTDTINLLRDKLRGLTEEEQTAYAKKLAGMTAFSGLLGVINATDEAYARLTGSTQAASFTTDENRDSVDALGYAMGAMMTNMGDVESTFNDLGLSVRNSKGEFGDLLDFTVRLRTGWGQLSEEEQKYFTGLLTNQETLSNFNSIMSMTDDEFSALVSSMDQAGGLAQILADQMLDNLSGKLMLLESATQNAKIAFGTLLIPVIEKVTEAFSKFVVWVNNLDEGQKKMIVTVGAVVTAIGPLLLIFGKLLSFGLQLHDNLGRLSSIFRLVGEAATGSASPVSLLSSAFSKLRGVATNLPSTLGNLASMFTSLSLPIKILIAVVGALALAWSTNFGNIRGIVSDFVRDHEDSFTAIGELISNVVGLVTDLLGGMIQVVQDWASEHQEAVEAISSVFETLFSVVSTVLGAILDFYGMVATVTNKAIDFFKGKADESKGTGKNLGESISDGFDEGLSNMSDNLGKPLGRVTDKLGEWGGVTSNAVKTTGTETGVSFGTGVELGVQSGLNVDSLGSLVTGTFGEVQPAANEIGIDIGETVGGGIDIGLAGMQQTIVANTSDELISAFEAAGTAVSVAGREMMDTATGEIVAVWNENINQWQMTDAGKIAAGLQEQVPYIADSIDAIAQAMGSKAPELKKVGNDLMIAATGEIVATYNNEMGKWQVTAPEKIVNGLYAAENSSRQAAQQLADVTAKGFITQWDVASFALQGEFDVIADYIRETYPEVHTAASEIADGYVDAIEKEINKFSTNNTISADMVKPFKEAGIQVKAESGNLINEATNEIMLKWDAGIQKFELTHAGKLALSVKAQEKATMEAGIANVVAAHNGIVSQWDILVAAMTGELFPQLPNALEQQTSKAQTAGQDNIQGYNSGVTSQWASSTMPWLSSRGPEVQSALSKGSSAAQSAGSRTMDSYWSGLKSKASSILQWAAQIASQIAAKLSASVAGIRVPSLGGSGRSGRSAVPAALTETMDLAAVSIDHMSSRMEQALSDSVTSFATGSRSIASTASKLSKGALGTVFQDFLQNLVDFFETTEDAIDEFKESSKKKIDSVLNVYVDSFKSMFKTLTNVCQTGLSSLKNTMASGFSFDSIDNLTETTVTKLEGLLYKLTDTIEEMSNSLQSALAKLTAEWNSGLDTITKPVEDEVTEIDDIWIDGLETLVDDTELTLGDLTDVTDSVLGDTQDLLETYSSDISSLLEDTSSTLEDLVPTEETTEMQSAYGDLDAQIVALRATYKDIGEEATLWNTKVEETIKLTTSLDAAMKSIASSFKDVTVSWSEIGNSAGTLSSGIDYSYDSIPTLKAALIEISNLTAEVFQSKKFNQGSVKNLTTSFKSQLSAIKTSLEDLGAVFDEKGKDIGKSGTNFINIFVDKFKEGWQNFVEWFIKESSREGISYLIRGIASWYATIRTSGYKFMQSFGNGMESYWSVLQNWFDSKVEYMTERLRRMQQIMREMQAVSSTSASSTYSEVTPTLISGSHRNGLPYVPYDGYVAELHQGERVLTKNEADEYKNQETKKSGDTFIFNSPKAIDAREATRLLKQTKRNILGGFI